MNIDDKFLLVGEIAKSVNDELRKHFGQKPSPVKASGKAAQYMYENSFPLDPEASWKRWKKERLEQGWVYGWEYDAEKKTHPNLTESYSALNFNERTKDYVFWAVCKAAFAALDKGGE